MSFDSAELCEKAVAEIDRSLNVGLLRYTVTRGIQEAGGSWESLEAGEHFGGEHTSTALVEGLADSQVRYDLVGEVARGATITRASAALILSSIAPVLFAQFGLNPEEFIAQCVRLIIQVKATMIVESVQYNRVSGEYDALIFTEKAPASYSQAYRGIKSIQDWVFPEGTSTMSVEHRFAHDLDTAGEAVV